MAKGESLTREDVTLLRSAVVLAHMPSAASNPPDDSPLPVDVEQTATLHRLIARITGEPPHAVWCPND